MNILKCGKFLYLPIHMLRTSTAASSDANVEQLAQISKLPPVTAHPVRFARNLILLALCLHQLDVSSPGLAETHLAGQVRDAARHYVEIANASRYVP